MCISCSDTSVSGIHPCMHGVNYRKTSVVFFHALCMKENCVQCREMHADMHERKLRPMQRDACRHACRICMQTETCTCRTNALHTCSACTADIKINNTLPQSSYTTDTIALCFAFSEFHLKK